MNNELWAYMVLIEIPYDIHECIRYYPGYYYTDALNSARIEFPDLGLDSFVVTKLHVSWEEFILNQT